MATRYAPLKFSYNQIPTDANFYMQIMIFLANCIDKYMFKVTNTTTDTALVSEVKKYINTNLDKKIDIQQIAKSFYMTPKYWDKFLKKSLAKVYYNIPKERKWKKHYFY